jgi:hypothetical protein
MRIASRTDGLGSSTWFIVNIITEHTNINNEFGSVWFQRFKFGAYFGKGVALVKRRHIATSVHNGPVGEALQDVRSRCSMLCDQRLAGEIRIHVSRSASADVLEG